MKRKKYVKPVVIIENFIVSQCIASCASIIEAADFNCIKDHYGEDDIIINYGGFTGAFNCSVDVDKDNGIYDGYCYHTLDGQNIMNS